uniref:Uncharacterized protein n=1 Tax=Anguilla anguilla TaxID=7936 RepID=A0A0E9UDH0_ANGAN
MKPPSKRLNTGPSWLILNNYTHFTARYLKTIKY